MSGGSGGAGTGATKSNMEVVPYGLAKQLYPATSQITSRDILGQDWAVGKCIKLSYEACVHS